MSEIKHTPGPWTYSRWDEHGYTKFYISQQEGAPYTPEYSDVADLISETVSGERVAIQEANTRLIAAAPELLEALQMFLVEKPIDEVIAYARECRAKASAAIAKAESKS